MLREELAAVRDRFLDRAPTHVKQSVAEATASLIESGVGQGLQVGEKAPDFTLVNATGEKVTLSELLQDRKVILNFYRGGWCPYCNLELKAYERILPKIKQKGAQLVAISPQMPDESLSTSEKNNKGLLGFFRYNEEKYNIGGENDASEATWTSDRSLRQSKERSIRDVDVCVLSRWDDHRYGDAYDAPRSPILL